MKGLQALYGMALMFITHDMGVVAEIADDVAVMYQGKVVEAGPVERSLLRRSIPTRSGYSNSVLALERRSHRAALMPKPDKTDAILEVSRAGYAFRTPAAPVRPQIARTSRCKALDEVGFRLQRGEILGIVGESGSGKTTLGRCIMRILEPSAGRMSCSRARDEDAIDLAALPIAARQAVLAARCV